MAARRAPRQAVQTKVKQLATAAYREAIVDAAERLFPRVGYRQATMSELAGEAGVSIGTLYNYFENKEQVFVSLMKRGQDEFFQALASALPQPDPLQRAIAIVRAAIAHVEKRGPLFTMFMQLGMVTESQIGNVMGKEHEEGYVRYLDLIRSTLSEAQSAGQLRQDVSAEFLAGALAGNVNALVFRWLHTDQQTPLTDQLDVVVDLFLTGVQKR